MWYGRGLFIWSGRVSSGGNLEVPCRAGRGDSTRQRALDGRLMLDLVTWGRSGKLTSVVPVEVSAEYRILGGGKVGWGVTGLCE